MNTTLVNCTPHPITLRSTTEESTIPPSGNIARVSSTPGELTHVPGVPVPVANPTTYGDVTGLPEPVPGTLYVVSAMVLSALKGTRTDVVGPGTGPNDNPVRNDKGQVVAVTRLVRG